MIVQLIIEKVSYRFHRPTRGDRVVFNLPAADLGEPELSFI